MTSYIENILRSKNILPSSK